MRRNKLFSWIGLTVAALFSAACNESSPSAILGPDMALVAEIQNSDNAYCTDLLAGQTTDAGDVCVAVNGSDLLVTYATTDGWEISEAHLFVGETQEGMPQARNGNPKIGNFPNNSGNITGATTHTFSVDLTQFGFDASPTSCDARNIFVAAHAALRKNNGNGTYQTETGWGDGYGLVDRGSWATGFQLKISCTGEEPKPEGDFETAFAFGGDVATCFIGADFDGDGNDDGLNRWGWSNGALTEGDYQFAIYAGAGRCDTSKGTLVGTLSVSYAGGQATVTYNVSSPYYMTESHLYVGSEPLPRNNGLYTVAPGQYAQIHDLGTATTDSYSVTGLTGTVYVVAHATVGGF